MADNGGFSNVELPEGFSEKELRWSFWFVKHREQLRKIGIATFVVIDVTLVLVGAWGMFDWLALSGVHEEQNVRMIASSAYAQAPQTAAVQEVQIGQPIVFSGANGKFDLVANVSNPNPWFWVELDYQFSAGGTDTPLRHAFVLPGETKNIAELGVERSGGLGDVQMKVVKRAFHRVDRHEIPDFTAWATKRLDLPTVDAKFVEPTPGATVPTSETVFTVVNQTAYSYYDVPVNVFVYRGESLVGANRVTFDKLVSGEKRTVDLFWYQALSGVTRIEAVPDINIFDPNVYKPPGTN